MCLRTPENAQQVIDAGGAEILVQVLATHMNNAIVAVSDTFFNYFSLHSSDMS